MFRYHPQSPKDIRRAVIDPTHRVGRKIINAARHAATAQIRHKDNSDRLHRLRDLMEPLNAADLENLESIGMISHLHSVSKTEDSIWAVATRLVNQQASIVRQRHPSPLLQPALFTTDPTPSHNRHTASKNALSLTPAHPAE